MSMLVLFITAVMECTHICVHICSLSVLCHWTHRVEWPKKSIFLEMKHHLLKFKETEVGWQAWCYLRRS